MTEILDRSTSSATKPSKFYSSMESCVLLWLLPTHNHPEKQGLKKERRKGRDRERKKETQKERWTCWHKIRGTRRSDNLHNLRRLISASHEIVVGISSSSSSRCCRTPRVIIVFWIVFIFTGWLQQEVVLSLTLGGLIWSQPLPAAAAAACESWSFICK